MHFFHSSSHSTAVVLYINWFRNKKKYVTQAYLMLKHIDESSIVRGQKSSQKNPKRCSFRQITKQIETAFLLQQCPFFLLCTESEFHNPFNLLNPNRDNKSTDGIIRIFFLQCFTFHSFKTIQKNEHVNVESQYFRYVP